MTEDHSGGARAKRPGLGSAVNLVLVALAFALLGLVLWQNRDKIHVVFAHPLDLRLLVLGVLIFQCSLLITYVRWYLLVRVIEPRFTLRSSMLLGFIGYVFNLVIPGADAYQEDTGHRLDGDRQDPRSARTVRAGGAGGSGGLERRGFIRRPQADRGRLDCDGARVLGAGVDLHPAPHPPFPRAGRLWPWPAGGHHDRAERDVHDLPAAARRRLPRPGPLGPGAYAQRHRVLPDEQDALPNHDDDHAGPAFLDGALDALHNGRAASFRSARAERGGRRPSRQTRRAPWGRAGDAGLPCLDVRLRADQCLRLPGESSRGPQPDH